MEKIFLAYESAKENTIKGDFIDRLHSKITVVFLFAICIIIGFKQYEGNQILCWLPHHFSNEQADYTHQLCWVNNTYYYPEVTDADLFPESSKDILLYYQYILFILFGQAMLFFLPTMIWELLAKNSVGYIKKILDQVQKASSLENFRTREEKKPKVAELDAILKGDKGKSSSASADPKDDTAQETDDDLDPLIVNKKFTDQFMSRFKSIVSFQNEHGTDDRKEEVGNEKGLIDEENLPLNLEPRHRFKSKSPRSSASSSKVLSFMKPLTGVQHLAFYYIFLKVLNLLNVIVQMFLLNIMFGNKFFTYGIDFFVNLFFKQNPFFLTTQFPIITFCDFFVHQNLRKVYYNSAQCILPINVLIEKFFLLVWFWYYLLIVLTLINIISWSFEMLPGYKRHFLTKYLNIRRRMKSMHNNHNNELSSFDSSPQKAAHREVKFDPSTSPFNDNEVESFCDNYFGNDGIIMLHIIKSVAGDMIFMDLLSVLWHDYNKSTGNKSTSTIEAD